MHCLRCSLSMSMRFLGQLCLTLTMKLLRFEVELMLLIRVQHGKWKSMTPECCVCCVPLLKSRVKNSRRRLMTAVACYACVNQFTCAVNVLRLIIIKWDFFLLIPNTMIYHDNTHCMESQYDEHFLTHHTN